MVSDIAKSLPLKPVRIVSEGSRVSISCERSSFTLPTLPVEDYPQLPSIPDVSGIVDADLFATAVGQVAVAAGRDDTLPTLTGVRMEFDGATVTLAATDRYRLAVREFTWKPNTSTLDVAALVPARNLADTAKSLAAEENVIIALGPAGERLIGFEGNSRRTTSRLLDGEFPKYRSLLPSESSSIADVDTGSLTEAVKRVALVADRRDTSPVRLAFGNGEVSLRAGAGDGAQATEALECGIQGDDIEIAFNPGYLLDGLNACGAATARFSFTQATRPAVLTGHGEGVVDDYRYLLMPVRLTG